MYLSLVEIQTFAATIYAIVGIISGLIAYDFIRSQDGILRKILISVFTSLSVHYLTIAVCFGLHVQRHLTIIAAACLTTLDFFALISLYYYMRWKKP